MIIRHASRSQQGFSLLEVLIAILVFSFGLIGLAGLIIFSISANHVAYLRTQATFLARNMADRMSANPAGLWGDNYNITAILAAGTPVSPCSTGCAPAALATHDIEAWSQQLHTFLPSAAATIACDKSALSFVPAANQVGMRPPYAGKCTMNLTWNEARSTSGARALHTFQWVFEP